MPGAADWTPVTAGGTSAVYTFAAQANQNGYVYRCRVSSGSVSVDSEAAALTVTASAAAVVITQNPQAQTVTAGSRATFSVAATGNDLTYQWYYLKPGAADWSPVITNGTSATYRLTAMARHNGYIYKCRVSSGSEYAESDTALLTVG